VAADARARGPGHAACRAARVPAALTGRARRRVHVRSARWPAVSRRLRERDVRGVRRPHPRADGAAVSACTRPRRSSRARRTRIKSSRSRIPYSSAMASSWTRSRYARTMWWSFPRCGCSLELQAQSYDVSKHNVATDIWGGDAMACKPERWLELSDKARAEPGWNHLSTFGYGSKSCIGQRCACLRRCITVC
jgi:hypothetical protein